MIRDNDDHLAVPVRSSCPPISRKQLLIMDDDPVMRTLFCEMFNGLGHDPVCVREGAEAITVYAKAYRTIHAYGQPGATPGRTSPPVTPVVIV